jgi:hypothetical protein
MNQWDKLLAQTQLTLNCLHTARVKPQLSITAYLDGIFNYNKTPLAPLGIKAIVHEKPKQ